MSSKEVYADINQVGLDYAELNMLPGPKMPCPTPETRQSARSSSRDLWE